MAGQSTLNTTIDAQMLNSTGVSYSLPAYNLLVAQLDQNEQITAATGSVVWQTRDLKISKIETNPNFITILSSLGVGAVGLAADNSAQITAIISTGVLKVKHGSILAFEDKMTLKSNESEIKSKDNVLKLDRLTGAGAVHLQANSAAVMYKLDAEQILLIDEEHYLAHEDSAKIEVYSLANQLSYGEGKYMLKAIGPGKIWLQGKANTKVNENYNNLIIGSVIGGLFIVGVVVGAAIATLLPYIVN